MYALNVSGNYPCVRVGKLTVAMQPHIHDALSLKWPPQFVRDYHRIDVHPYMTPREMTTRIAEHPAQLIHVHNEPSWPVVAAADGAHGRPVIFNVHDVTSAREGEPVDAWERQAYERADALCFITEEQREFAVSVGLPVEGKPYCVVPNYAVRRQFITSTPFGHTGGVVYAGGAHKRSGGTQWRDMSPIADVVDALHIYSATGTQLDYGIPHMPESDYTRLIYRLASHDWGFVGIPLAHPGYDHAIPNKFADAFAAGIPIIAMNVPLMRPICERGLGIYCETYAEVGEASRTDPAPYRERVLQLRHEYTMEAVVGPLVELYEALI